ncbi:hypothetical protein Goklo_025935, partial [Gossypium klotzschianum]|nr:hypothetical protein [Gossypium klotzschianum]
HIPVTLGNLRDLELLDLSDNDLSGTLSSSERSFLSSLANCSGLTTLAFGSNPLISGYLPPSIANLSVSLQYFDASSCSISGSIPGEIGNWNVATYLDFSGNHFSGAISDRVCKRNNDLRYLAVNDNQLEGTLPLSLTNCSELVFLNVADNNLSDTFPHWLGILPQLRVLILRSNRFHGSIQSYIATSSFSKLQIIDLSHNDFTGLLPTYFFQNLMAMKEAEYVDNGMSPRKDEVPQLVQEQGFFSFHGLGFSPLARSLRVLNFTNDRNVFFFKAISSGPVDVLFCFHGCLWLVRMVERDMQNKV